MVACRGRPLLRALVSQWLGSGLQRRVWLRDVVATVDDGLLAIEQLRIDTLALHDSNT